MGTNGPWPGVRVTTTGGILFTEEMPSGTLLVRRVKVSISRQNANLVEVKNRMAEEATKVGATAIVGFQYGQRSHKWWQQAFTFKWDTESWFGEGDAVTF